MLEIKLLNNKPNQSSDINTIFVSPPPLINENMLTICLCVLCYNKQYLKYNMIITIKKYLKIFVMSYSY